MITRREEGMTVVMVLVCLTALLGVLAISLESGRLYLVRNQTQATADAAALAAAQALQSCNAGATDRDAAINAAKTTAAANPVDGQTMTLSDVDIEIGRYYPFSNGPDGTFTVTNANPNSVRVIARRDNNVNGEIPLTIGKLLGIDSVPVTTEAIGTRDRRVDGFDTPPGARSSLIPFAGSEGSFGPVGTPVSFFEGVQGGVAPGNWALIDIAETGFTTETNVSQPTIEDQIAHGYQGDVSLDQNGGNTSGRTGTLGGSIADALASRVGDVVTIAVYDSISGVGTGATFHITGFVSIRIDSFVVTGPLSQRGIFGTVVEATDSTASTDGDADESCLISKLSLTK